MDDFEPNPRAVEGDNAPAVALVTPYDQSHKRINDLRLEALNWADATKLENDAQAEECSFLIDQLRKADVEGEERRKAEKKPHDDAAKAVQDKWKPVLEVGERALDTCRKTLADYLRRKEDAQRAEAERVRKLAEDAANEAAAARALANPLSLADQEEAEALTHEAEQLAKGANRAERATAHATGGTRAMGLRTSWNVTVANEVLALRTMMALHRPELVAYALTLAKQDVRSGKRQLEGFTIEPERKL